MVRMKENQKQSDGGVNWVQVLLRLHPRMAEQLDVLVDQNITDRTEEIRVAIREKLERAGLWPPQAKPKK